MHMHVQPSEKSKQDTCACVKDLHTKICKRYNSCELGTISTLQREIETPPNIHMKPSDLSCSSHSETRSSDISEKLSSSKALATNLPSRTDLDSVYSIPSSAH